MNAANGKSIYNANIMPLVQSYLYFSMDVFFLKSFVVTLLHGLPAQSDLMNKSKVNNQRR